MLKFSLWIRFFGKSLQSVLCTRQRWNCNFNFSSMGKSWGQWTLGFTVFHYHSVFSFPLLTSVDAGEWVTVYSCNNVRNNRKWLISCTFHNIKCNYKQTESTMFYCWINEKCHPWKIDKKRNKILWDMLQLENDFWVGTVTLLHVTTLHQWLFSYNFTPHQILFHREARETTYNGVKM